jgi:hypothetical protein
VVIAKTHKSKWRVLAMGLKGVIRQIQLATEKKYCACVIQPTSSNVPLLTIWNYKKERLIASANIKAQFDKFSFHPLKGKNVSSSL